MIHDTNLLLSGEEAAITALSTQPPRKEAGPLTPKLRAAALGNDMFFFGYHVSAEMRQMAGPMGGPMGDPMAGGPMGGGPGFKLSFVSDVLSGQIALTEDRTIHGRISLDFADAAKATKAKEDLDATLGMFRIMFPQMKGQMRGANPRMLAIAEKALEKARPVVVGNSVELPMEYETTIGELIEQAKPMMGMFGPGMGPGMGGMPGPPPVPQRPPVPPPNPVRPRR